MDNMVTVELDFVTEPGETPEQGMAAMLRGRDDITGRVIKETGCGGWPVAEFQGPRTSIVKMMRRFSFDPADYGIRS